MALATTAPQYAYDITKFVKNNIQGHSRSPNLVHKRVARVLATTAELLLEKRLRLVVADCAIQQQPQHVCPNYVCWTYTK